MPDWFWTSNLIKTSLSFLSGLLISTVPCFFILSEFLPKTAGFGNIFIYIFFSSLWPSNDGNINGVQMVV